MTEQPEVKVTPQERKALNWLSTKHGCAPSYFTLNGLRTKGLLNRDLNGIMSLTAQGAAVIGVTIKAEPEDEDPHES